MRDGQTGQAIAEAALALFSRRGYDAVSIRDICAAVGIKESTLYYYYANKRALYDRLLADVRAHIEGMRANFMDQFEAAGRVDEDAFADVAVGFLLGYFLNPAVDRFLSMLAIGAYADAEAAALYRALSFEVPVEHQTMVFGRMIALGMFRPDDARALALEYHALVMMTYQSRIGLNMENRRTAGDELAGFARRFFRTHAEEAGV